MIKSKGFTLLEILVALFIFVILSGIATVGLYQVFQAKEIQQQHANELSELQIAYLIIRHDIEQIIDRPIIDNDGTTPLRALIGDAAKMQFTRTGNVNPRAIDKESHLKRVAYLVKEGKLMRLSWPVLDRMTDTQAEEQILLNQVTDFKIRYFINEQKSYEFWPPSGQYLSGSQIQAQGTSADVFPKAIEITLDTLTFGQSQLMVTVHANTLKFKQTA